ncbi:MAG: hypothetical protein J0I12_16330 [Candidatus Eremiobacteraeota bacterium]|nr:hypothetical protein [Candidatus Eremiobacteraeota bacterium]
MVRIVRHLTIFLLLGISILGVIFGLRGGNLDIDPRWGLAAVTIPIALLVAYVLLVLFLGWLQQRLFRTHPKWAEHIAKISGLITGGQSHRATLIGLQVDNAAECDRIWKEAEPKLPNLSSSEAMTVGLNYSVSLSRRGQLTKARDIALQYPPREHFKAYQHHYALYWLNLGWYHLELGEHEQAEYCLRRALQETLTQVDIKTRQEGLQALLAHEAGERDSALKALRENKRRQPYHAWLLAEIGEMEEAAERLPDLVSLADASDRTYYHLTQALIQKSPAELEKASQNDFCSGKVAFYAVTLFGDESYLSKARKQDPESVWTRRAETAAQESAPG